MRYLHFQHHDGNDDGDHAVAERLQPPFGHLPSATFPGTEAASLSQPSGLCLVAAFYPVSLAGTSRLGSLGERRLILWSLHCVFAVGGSPLACASASCRFLTSGVTHSRLIYSY